MTATRRNPEPVDDPRSGTPAQQLRASLARQRTAGIDFDAAWDIALGRIKWPHDTVHRVQWKAIIEADRHAWRDAYEYVAPEPQQAACGALAQA